MMTIVRIDAEARWSDVVIHNNTLYYTGVPENLDADAFEQTANTLAINRAFWMPPFSWPIKTTSRR